MADGSHTPSPGLPQVSYGTLPQEKHLPHPVPGLIFLLLLGFDFLVSNGMMTIMAYMKVVFLKRHFRVVKAPFEYLWSYITSFDLFLSTYNILELSYTFTASHFTNKKNEAQKYQLP